MRLEFTILTHEINLIMKNFLFSIFFFILYVSLYANEGKVIKLKGKVTVKRAETELILQKDTVLKIGDILQTDKGGFAKVSFLDHTLYVFSNSQLTLTADKKKEKIQIEQKKGSSWYKVSPLLKKQSFSVKTPSAVAGVRGTGFIVSVMNDLVSSVCVCKGEVEVEAGGKKVLLKKGVGAKLMKDTPPLDVHSNFSRISKPRLLKRNKDCMGCHSDLGNLYD